MLHITKVIGNQVAVYDTDDGTLEWVKKSDILAYQNQGVIFKQGEIEVPQSMCNFGSNKENIFSNYRVRKLGGDKFELVSFSAEKKLKFRLVGDKIHFTAGILTSANGIF